MKQVKKSIKFDRGCYVFEELNLNPLLKISKGYTDGHHYLYAKVNSKLNKIKIN